MTNLLAELVKLPEYDGASIGVLCLFSDQVALLQELVNDRFDEADIVEHTSSWSTRMASRAMSAT